MQNEVSNRYRCSINIYIPVIEMAVVAPKGSVTLLHP